MRRRREQRDDDDDPWNEDLIEEALDPLPKCLPYHLYIDTQEWKSRANAARARADHRCQVCNSNKKRLDVHHRTYVRYGNEYNRDLIVLCCDCHSLFHRNGKLAR